MQIALCVRVVFVCVCVCVPMVYILNWVIYILTQQNPLVSDLRTPLENLNVNMIFFYISLVCSSLRSAHKSLNRPIEIIFSALQFKPMRQCYAIFTHSMCVCA